MIKIYIIAGLVVAVLGGLVAVLGGLVAWHIRNLNDNIEALTTQNTALAAQVETNLSFTSKYGASKAAADSEITRLLTNSEGIKDDEKFPVPDSVRDVINQL